MNTETLELRKTRLPVPISIDMSMVCSLVRGAHDTPELPPAEPGLRLSTEDPSPELRLSLPYDPPIALQLSMLEEPLARTLKLHPIPDSPVRLTLRPLGADSYQVQIGDDSQVRLEIPRGLDRFCNAATLKAMVVGGSPDDVLFRKTGERWDICDDADRIDLEDRTATFKLGRIEIQS